jgi:hypothetical protein
VIHSFAFQDRHRLRPPYRPAVETRHPIPRSPASSARYFGLAAHEMVYCGMALGYADLGAAVNTLRSRRAQVEQFAEFRGFQ